MTPCLFVLCFICFGTADFEAAAGSVNFFSNDRNSGFIVIVSPRFNYQVFFLKCNKCAELPPCHAPGLGPEEEE